MRSLIVIAKFVGVLPKSYCAACVYTTSLTASSECSHPGNVATSYCNPWIKRHSQIDKNLAGCCPDFAAKEPT